MRGKLEREDDEYDSEPTQGADESEVDESEEDGSEVDEAEEDEAEEDESQKDEPEKNAPKKDESEDHGDNNNLDFAYSDNEADLYGRIRVFLACLMTGIVV
jgi:hypothetical protein